MKYFRHEIFAIYGTFKLPHSFHIQYCTTIIRKKVDHLRLTHQFLGERCHVQWSILELGCDDGWHGTRLHYDQVMGTMVGAQMLHVCEVWGGGRGVLGSGWSIRCTQGRSIRRERVEHTASEMG